MSQPQPTSVTTLSDSTDSVMDTAFAMALLWVIPVLAFLLTLTRL